MNWRFKKQSNARKIIISLSENEVRLFHVDSKSSTVTLLDSHCFGYESFEQLKNECTDWIQKTRIKRVDCHWLLSRKLYQAVNLKPPAVSESELDSSIKWLVKDQIEQPIEKVLVAHYKPIDLEQENSKLTAIIVEKELVENLIDCTEQIDLNLVSIQINELAITTTLQNQLTENKITGYIDEDNQGLIYNFYIGNELAFTRHIKGRFFPVDSQNELSLDNHEEESQQDRFLLETQRTLDYCISQIFRKPVDSLIIDAAKVKNSDLVAALEQVTELPVSCFEALVSDSRTPLEDQKEASNNLSINLTELGIANSDTIVNRQKVNLFFPEYHPKPLEFGFKFASIVIAVFAVSFIGYGVVLTLEENQLKLQLNQEKNRLITIQNAIQELQAKTKSNNNNQDVDKAIIRRTKELAQSKALLARVSHTPSGKTVSFSRILYALSKQKSDSLWLTKISLSPLSINLSGKTTSPNSVPNYIESMAKDEIISRRYSELQLERDETDSRLINFAINDGRYLNAE